jgi:hypothetical protein
MIVKIIPRKFGKPINYFHWWVDFYLPYLVQKRKFDNVKVYGESCGFWKIDPSVEFSTDENFIIIKGYNPLYVKWKPEIIYEIMNLKEKYIKNSCVPIQIYIERLSDKRYIKNSTDVYILLKQIWPNIKKVNLENMELKSQIELFSKANLVVGQHGAGLTNIMWCPKGSKIFEIDKNMGRLHFANMSTYLGHVHFKYAAVKTPMNNIRQKQIAERIHVDLLEFKDFIESKNNEHCDPRDVRLL